MSLDKREERNNLEYDDIEIVGGTLTFKRLLISLISYTFKKP